MNYGLPNGHQSSSSKAFLPPHSKYSLRSSRRLLQSIDSACTSPHNQLSCSTDTPSAYQPNWPLTRIHWASSHIIKDRNPKLITALNIPDNKSQGPFRSTHSVRNSPTSPIKLCKVVVSTLWQYTSQWWMDSAPLTHVAKRPVSVFNQLSRVKNLPERLSHPHQ